MFVLPVRACYRFYAAGEPYCWPPVSFSRSACSASSEASEPPVSPEPLSDEDVSVPPLEYDVASPASTSALAASACCLTCASQRACALAYCSSQVARCSSKPSSHSPVSG